MEKMRQCHRLLPLCALPCQCHCHWPSMGRGGIAYIDQYMLGYMHTIVIYIYINIYLFISIDIDWYVVWWILSLRSDVGWHSGKMAWVNLHFYASKRVSIATVVHLVESTTWFSRDGILETLEYNWIWNFNNGRWILLNWCSPPSKQLRHLGPHERLELQNLSEQAFFLPKNWGNHVYSVWICQDSTNHNQVTLVNSHVNIIIIIIFDIFFFIRGGAFTLWLFIFRPWTCTITFFR